MTTTSTDFAEIARLMAEAIDAIEQTDDCHPFTEYAGRGCERCGKNRNGGAHSRFYRLANDTRVAVRDEYLSSH